MTDQEADVTSIANRWIEAYNAKDFDAIRSLCADDIRMRHHNRGVDVTGPDAVIELMEQFGPIVPDRRFHSTRRQFTDGERVVTEQSWGGTPTADVPGFATKGEEIKLELSCIWTVRNGRIAEYDDYG
jgi:steroid delta-isomerase-like uncharacterized protein